MGNTIGTHRRGLAIGSGGTLGAAWIVAALAAIREVLDWGTSRIPERSGGMSDTLDAEIAAARASGTRVLHVAATAADLSVMGPNFMDNRRQRATLEHAMVSTRRTIEQGDSA